jgi:hypothetical protein
MGTVVAAAVALIWSFCNRDSLPLGSPSWTALTIVFLLLCLGHEGLHLLGFPNAGFDRHTVIGLWAEFGSPYVQYLSPMVRTRFVFTALLPFLVLTILPFPLASIFPESVAYLSWVSVLNSVGAGSDILVAAKLLSMVPRDALVIESGELMYWRHR